VQRKWGPQARLVGSSGDIKDMFTELDHARLCRGVDVIIEWGRQTLRGKHLSVQVTGRAGVFVGKPPDRQIQSGDTRANPRGHAL